MGPAAAPVRLSDLVATLSLVADLGMGRPMERVLRQTVITLFLVHLIDFFLAWGVGVAERAWGLVHTVTGLWLMYLTSVVTVTCSAAVPTPPARCCPPSAAR